MTALEVALVAALMMLLTYFSINLWIFVYGYTVNDAAARDAARAAAAAGDKVTAERHILATLLRHRGFGPVGDPVCDFRNSQQAFIYGKDTDDGIPFVRVTTRCTLTPPFPIYLFGKGWKSGPSQLIRTYTFPLLVCPFNPHPVTHGSTDKTTGEGEDGEEPVFD